MNIFKKIKRYKKRVNLLKKYKWIDIDIKYFYNSGFYISKKDIFNLSDNDFELVYNFLRY